MQTMRQSVLIACSLALLACGGSSGATSSTPEQPRTLPRDFALQDMTGNQVALGEVIGTRVAVIDFWATWCKPCKKSLPKVDALAVAMAEQNVAVLAINIGEKAAPVQAFQQELGLSLPILLDGEMALPPMLDIHELPGLIVVDKSGQVVHVGKTFDAAARAQLDALLAQ